MAATARTSSRRRKAAHSEEKVDALTRSALKFIDQAASLLKKGVRKGGRETVAARHAFKRKALKLVGQATGHLVEAVDKGGAALRKGLHKL